MHFVHCISRVAFCTQAARMRNAWWWLWWWWWCATELCGEVLLQQIESPLGSGKIVRYDALVCAVTEVQLGMSNEVKL